MPPITYITLMDHALTTKTAKAFRKNLRTWFRTNARDLPWRGCGDPYRIWVSEVMLQQTQVATVIPYYERFVAKYPDILTLAKADQQDILKSWENLGYYARARNLHRAAGIVVEELGGSIPVEYTAFRTLPGVGEYIGAAVMSIAHGAPHAVVDGNVKRVLARLAGIDTPVNTAASRQAFADVAQQLLDLSDPGAHNQAIMELGALVCRPRRPSCERCPVAQQCSAFETRRQGELPVRQPRKAVPHYHIAVGVVRDGDRILITRRKADGLLGGLWEFPGGKVKDGESPEAACRREIAEETCLDVTVTDYLTHVDHAYTHFKIGVDVYSCEYVSGDVTLKGPVDYRWIVAKDIDDYPFPGANHKFLPLVKERLNDS